jgi:hypothetical protein
MMSAMSRLRAIPAGALLVASFLNPIEKSSMGWDEPGRQETLADDLAKRLTCVKSLKDLG